MIKNVLIGSNGLVGSAVLRELIINDYSFFIFDRSNPNCLNEIADQKIKTINIINCAFNFNNLYQNYDFINILFNSLRINNIKINTYVNISSVNAFSNEHGKFTFTKATPIDKYGQEKKRIDDLIYSHWKSKNIKNLVTFVPFIISGGFWDKILSEKVINYFDPGFKICKISSKDFAILIIKELIKKNHSNKKKLIFLKNKPIYLNQSKKCSFQFKFVQIIYKNINNKILQYELLQKLISILYKFTRLPFFFLLRYFYSFNLINSFIKNKIK